jgi:hypothetical protein
MRRHPPVKRVHDPHVARLRAILPSALLVSRSFGSVHFGVRRDLVLLSSDLSRYEQVRRG